MNGLWHRLISTTSSQKNELELRMPLLLQDDEENENEQPTFLTVEPQLLPTTNRTVRHGDGDELTLRALRILASCLLCFQTILLFSIYDAGK